MERSNFIKWFLIIINLSLIVISILFYRFIFSYIIVGFIFAYLIAPIINYAEKYRIPRTVSIIAVYLIIAFLIVLISYAIIPQIVQQYNGFQKTFTKLINSEESFNWDTLGLEKVSEYVERIQTKFPNLEIAKTVNSLFNKDKINDLLNQIPKVFKGVFNVLAFLVVIPVIGFFLLKDERIFRKYIFSQIPNRYFEFSIHLFEKIEESFGKFFRALLLESILVALLSIIGLLILKIPYALILGIIVGLANPIKYFGPFISAVPTIIVILISPIPNGYVFYAAIMYFIVQQIDSLILFPWLIGKSMDIHPLFVLLTVIAGGYAFGILGMLFAVPVVFLIKVIYQVSHKSLKEFEII